ncbi:tyrosine-type recombinase/integrase [bacterium]|nr:tyrosine-type recombinase/integrase [bacterium]
MKLQDLLKKTKNKLRRKNYSSETIKAYLFCLSDYFEFVKNIEKDPDVNIIKKYLLIKKNKKLSSQTINQHLNAIKYFYREIMKSNNKVNIKFVKKSKNLPVILTHKEINKILAQISNFKHKIIISLSYGAGLRIGEIINLQAKDINLDELTIKIKKDKGKKDRITIFPKSLKNDLFILIKNKNLSLQKWGTKNFAFKSNRDGKLTDRSIQIFFKNVLKKAKIKKKVSFRSLRHSFAVHLLENGIDIQHIQKLLGHQNIRSTQLYAKIAKINLKNIKSPL